MNLIQRLTPPKELFRNMTLPPTCDFHSLGEQVHRQLPYSISSLVATILSSLSESFKASYTYKVGQRYCRFKQTLLLTEATEKIHTTGVRALRPMQDFPNVTRCRINTKRSVYLKRSEYSTDGRACLEALVWKCAKILKLDEYFAPTIFSKNLGCVQLEIEGEPLSELIDGNYIGLERNQVITGLLATLFFGFTDAHSGNIIVDESNKLHFVDNVRCFPHSNGCIRIANGQLIASFRSGLMESLIVYKELLEDDWRLMGELIARFEEKIPAIEKAFAKVDESLFPPNWFLPVKAFVALRMRVQIMKENIESRTFSCLRDLVFLVHPHYRFIAALTLASLSESNVQVIQNMDPYASLRDDERNEHIYYLQSFTFGNLCGHGYSISSLLNSRTRVRLKLLWERCADFTLPFKSIIDWIGISQKEHTNSPITIDMITEALGKEAHLDYKI